MTTPVNIASKRDAQQLMGILFDLTVYQKAGVVPVNLGRYFDGTVQVSFFAQGGTTPAWAIIDRSDSLIVAVAGISTLVQGAAVFGSALLPLTQRGSWSAGAALVADVDVLAARVLASFPDMRRTVTLLGHSYGGGLVQVLAAELLDARPGINLQILTAGSPRPGDQTLQARLSQVPSLRLMNDSDPIPRFPPHFQEAPLGTVALGPAGALLFSQYVQGGQGVVLDILGRPTSGQLPPLDLPIADLDLIGWATGTNGVGARDHGIGEYVNRVNLAVAALPSVPDAEPAGAPGETASPMTPAAFAAAAASVAASAASPVAGGKPMAAFIPVSFRAKVFKTPTQYVVMWMSVVIYVGQTKSNAKTLAKYVNKWLRVMQTAKSADHTNLGNALQSYLISAAAPSAGFIPVLTVT